MTNKLYYIGRRDNPQLSKPYYKKFGYLTKKQVKEKENCLYGSMTLLPFTSKKNYETEISLLKSEGYSVTDGV